VQLGEGLMKFQPYPYQRDFLQDASPRRLIVKARQIGFSQVVGIEAAYKAITTPYRKILFVSRNQRMASELLDYCYNAFAGLQGDDFPNLTKHNTIEIELANGSQIISLPANRTAGRGFPATDVYLDEMGFLEYAEDIYRSVSPTLSRGGTLTGFSSANGRQGLFWQLWSGQVPGEWSRMFLPWQQCPVYDAAWYARERPKYTAADWAQEYDCDFATSGNAVFKPEDVDAAADGWFGLQSPMSNRLYITAWDIGRRQDATVGITLDVTGDDWQTVAFERMVGEPYPVIQRAIERRAQAYGGMSVVESNGVGDPVIENLVVHVEPFVTTRRTKTDAITALALATEQGRLKHGIEDLAREQKLYQWRDEGITQDCVMAAAIACYVAGIQVVPDQLLYDDDEPVMISPY
jgi:hypothetical protein